jgi:dihydrofolate synthase/folylpolyglutamate synthase
LTALLDAVRVALEQPTSLDATFFEIATALGFLYFARRGVDAAVVEVGLGGRFDSTNVCRPVVAVITSISFDHTQQLGSRLALIAMEKAGIVKPGRPAISGATAPEPREVIEQICRERGSPLRQLGVDFRYEYEPGRIGAEGRRQEAEGRRQKAEDSQGPRGLPPAYCLLPSEERPRVRVITDRRTWPVMELGLLGEHQAANAAVAVACVEQLRDEGWPISDAAVAEGLRGVRWPARLEVVGRRPLVVLDCAHNDASARALVETLQASFPPARRLLLFASSNDKDVVGIFRILAPHFAHAFLTCYHSARSTPPEQLADLLRASGDLPFTICPSAAEAWQAARELARPDDLICVTGSVYLAGELRPLLVA